MVAKTYTTWEILDTPYYGSNKRLYVHVKNPKTGAAKEVRYYTEAEYSKLYPSDTSIVTPKDLTSAHDIFGFGGPTNSITIILLPQDTNPEDNDYFKVSAARYSCLWGWYFTSNTPLPSDLPEDCTALPLPWSVVSNASGELKSKNEIMLAINKMRAADSPSTHQGIPGEKISIRVIVNKSITTLTQFGATTFHVMADPEGNIYTWTTGSKHWEEGSIHDITAKVKEHTYFNGVAQTVINYCKERKD